ncbi:MAG: hypothetical protein ABJP45_04500 [Cyclobacteriaceae bacterium]
MKKITSCLFMILCIFMLNGQEIQPNTISERNVPKAVLKKFKERRTEATDVKWYPYPNQYGKDVSKALAYYPAGWAGNVQGFYEVRFSDKKGAVREVYERGGTWRVTSRPIQGDLPPEITAQLSEKGYDSWSKGKQELISRVNVQSKFYKIWFTQGKKTRILFFTESYRHTKTLRWDNDTKLMVNADVKPKATASVKRNKRPIAAKDVPATVKAKAKKNQAEIEILEWFTYAHVQNPLAIEDQDFSYYDIPTPAFYQLIYTDKSGKFMASYSTEGELLEVAQLVTTKMLPKAIKRTLQTEVYAEWKWEDEHELVEVEDQVFYRLYGAQNDTPGIITLNSKGEKPEKK